MIYLLISILISSGLFVIFKFFGIYKVDTLKAIFINYVVAFIFGFASSSKSIPVTEIPQQSWFIGALVLGALFVSIFFVMAMTAQQNGVSVASIAGKMSVVIPVFFGVFLYNESVTLLKVSGILIALVAVYLSSVKKKNENKPTGGLLFPILLFIGSGAIDTILKYMETNFVAEDEIPIFSGSLFAIAAFFGLLVLIYKNIKKPEPFGWKNVLAGVILGIPNYYSIVFLIKALQVKGFESSTLFTINNVGIVIVSTIIGILFFKESFSTKNKIGVALAIVGIVIMAYTK